MMYDINLCKKSLFLLSRQFLMDDGISFFQVIKDQKTFIENQTFT